MIKKPSKNEQELIADLQRVRADFENYRKRIETEKTQLSEMTKAATVLKLLPVIDNIELAIDHAPADLIQDKWVQGVLSLSKSLEKSLGELGLSKIIAQPDTVFDPSLHEAVMAEGEGQNEVIAQELRPGYVLDGVVVRPSLVKVVRQD